MTLSFGNSREYSKFWVQVLSKIHDGGDIAAAVAIIRSTPNGDNRFVFEVPLHRISLRLFRRDTSMSYLVAFIYKLMGTSNKLKAVDVVKFCSDLVAKQPPSTTRGYSPSPNVFRITPDQITEGAFVRNLLGSSNDAYLVKGTDLRTQTTVDTKHFPVNDSTEDQEIKDLTTSFPDRGIAIFLLAFFVKSVDLCDLARFMVAPDEGHAIRVSIWVSATRY